MNTGSTAIGFSNERAEQNRLRISEIRERAQKLADKGSTGIQVAAVLSEQTDELLRALYENVLANLTPENRTLVENHAAVIAVGGSGRGELSPYSDTDLLFLYAGKAAQPFAECSSQMVRDCWDAGLSLGHSVRTIGDSISFARADPEIATSLLEARLLSGNKALFDRFKKQFRRKVIRGRLRTFIGDCLQARGKERVQYGESVRRLEPDLKRAHGGLRDIHLIRWIGGACYGTTNIQSLRLCGALSREEARTLLAAEEYLVRIRNDLHFHADRSQDVLTRQDQLRIAEQRHIEGSVSQRPVEQLMQTFFQHSTAIAEIAQRFVDLHHRKSARKRITDFITTRRVNHIFKIGENQLDVIPRFRERVCGNLEEILRMYSSAVLFQVTPTPQLSFRVKQSAPELEETPSPKCHRLFLEILRNSGSLGQVLRNMYNTGVLELLLPEMTHARCLIQFNQYHSYTVDEHTLKAVEAAERFLFDSGPIGAAYQAIRHKEILHLALLLHDLGKGFEGDHSDVGLELAENVARRLDLPNHHRETLTFLVHKHLRMAHLAFRRDISDPQVLLEFAHEVGSPETLRMLYVLTAADISAVGPGVWTDWKADLLSDLFDKAMLVLSGKHHRFQEEERLRQIKEHVRASVVPLEEEETTSALKQWFDEQLDALPPHYLSGNSPSQIAADLSVVRQLKSGEVFVEGRFDPESRTMEYQIIASPERAAGCFHKTAGLLTAKHMQILSAQISTSLEGVVIDSYRVLDDFSAGEIPRERIDEISKSLESVLTSRTSVSQLFQRHMRFDAGSDHQPVSEMPTRVVIDNDSSDHCTVIDIFAHDWPGLLYTITRALHQMDLSVMLAKISTHLDQVVDVFYVTDSSDKKIKDGNRLKAIREDLQSTIEEFEREGYLRFVN